MRFCLAPDYTQECDKFQMIHGIGDDVEFGDLDTHPLYQVIENTSSDDPLSECDLLHWFTNIMKDTKASNDAIETAAWLFTTADSAARGARGRLSFRCSKSGTMATFLKSQTMAGPSSRCAISMPWCEYLMKNGVLLLFSYGCILHVLQ